MSVFDTVTLVFASSTSRTVLPSPSVVLVPVVVTLPRSSMVNVVSVATA